MGFGPFVSGGSHKTPPKKKFYFYPSPHINQGLTSTRPKKVLTKDNNATTIRLLCGSLNRRKSMAKRIYEVRSDKTVWLVRAHTKNGALAHVATKVLSAEVASQDALIKAVTAGVAVEDVGEVVPDGIDPVI
jgi:hypothetical protein